MVCWVILPSKVNWKIYHTDQLMHIMKKVLGLVLFLFFLFQSSISRADAWDNLTMEEAKSVVAKLEKDPFIFDYCDCCDHGETRLLLNHHCPSLYLALSIV